MSQRAAFSRMMAFAFSSESSPRDCPSTFSRSPCGSTAPKFRTELLKEA
jgi:hypothetical protein